MVTPSSKIVTDRFDEQKMIVLATFDQGIVQQDHVRTVALASIMVTAFFVPVRHNGWVQHAPLSDLVLPPLPQHQVNLFIKEK